jgi:fructose-bisphosphate aldolase class I
MDGAHTLEACRAATSRVLHAVFEELYLQGVQLDGMILKPNLVLPGLACPQQETAAVIADVTVRTLRGVVPALVPGVAFLSGGQSGELASTRLNEMNRLAKTLRSPWSLVFSFARALQMPALTIWRGEDERRAAAQAAVAHRARCNLAALRGDYTQGMELEDG